MKYLVICLNFICIAAAAQSKGDNRIIASHTSFAQVKSALLDSGYFFSQSDSTDGTIVTKPASADTYRMFGQPMDRFHVVMYIRVKDSVATIRGELMMTTNTGSIFASNKEDWQPIEYWNAKSSIPHVCFIYMVKAAKSFSSDLAYAKK